MGLLAAMLTGALYVAWLRRSGNWTEGLGWERTLLLKIPRPLPPVLDTIFLTVPWLGTNLTIFPLTVLVVAWLAWRRARPDLALHILVVVVGSLALNALLKDLFGRPRPSLWEHRGQYKWSAFPSGHSIVGISVILTVAILLHRERGWRWPYAVVVTLLVVNNFSRLYLGVHWPTDVIGGLIIGAVWLGFTLYAFRPASIRRRTT